MVQPEQKKRTFIILRYVLIVAGAYLFLSADQSAQPSKFVALLVASALGSNVILAACPTARVLSISGLLAVVLVDISWISAGLWLTNDLGADLLILYLLVLVSAAASESIILVVSTALLAGVAYLMVLGTSSSTGDILTTTNLMRLPFLFAAALACGYLVEELKRERRQAEKNQQLEEMWTKALAAVVRNLQAPVQTMAAGLEHLQRIKPAQPSKGVRKGLNEVAANVEYLSMLIDNYVDFARIRAGSMTRETQPTKLAEIINQTAARFTSLTELRGIKLVTAPAVELPEIRADREAIQHSLANLVHNAIKFSRPGGKVEIKGTVAEGCVEIIVNDTGWGIPVEERPSLSSVHEGFCPAEEGGQPRLGLHVATHLVELHGGSIHIQSTTMQGSRFSIKLPVDLPTRGRPPDAPSSNYREAPSSA